MQDHWLGRRKRSNVAASDPLSPCGARRGSTDARNGVQGLAVVTLHSLTLRP